MSIKNLLNKSKGLSNETPSILSNIKNPINKPTQIQTGISQQPVNAKPKPFKLGIGVANLDKIDLVEIALD